MRAVTTWAMCWSSSPTASCPSTVAAPSRAIRPMCMPIVTTISQFIPRSGRMVMEARTGSAEGYRFGFQGQETDDEVYGSENTVSFKYRVHDARIGRFLSIDPLTAKYPFYSPYAFSGNRVIDMVELEGLEPVKGDLNYGSNVVLSLMGNLNSDLTSAEPRDMRNTNWIGDSHTSFGEGVQAIQKVKLEQESATGVSISLNNLVIVTHGIDDLNHNTIGIQGGQYDLSNIQTADLQLFMDIQRGGGPEKFREGKNFQFNYDRWLNVEYQTILGLQGLMNEVADGGNCIFLSCSISESPELMKLMYRLSGERINIVGSQNLNTVAGDGSTTDPLDILYDPNGYSSGWQIIGPLTNGKLRDTKKVKGGDTLLIQTEGDKPVTYEDEP